MSKTKTLQSVSTVIEVIRGVCTYINHVISFQIYECLVTPNCLLIKDYGLPGMFPIMTTLLRFSAKEFLNVLSLVKFELKRRCCNEFFCRQNLCVVVLCKGFKMSILAWDA